MIILIMIFSNATITAAKNAVELFAYSIVPSLFPFFVFTNMLVKNGKTALISGFLCGYPAGAIACTSLYRQGSIRRHNAEFFSSFTNNAGPAFILGTVGITMFGSAKIGILLLLTHMAGAFTVMLLFCIFFKQKAQETPSGHFKQEELPENRIYFGEQLTNAIVAALKQVASVGGYIVLFAVIISVLGEIGLKNGFLFSFLEVTTGLKYISDSIPKEDFLPAVIKMLPITALFLGWSGLSIHAQIIAILNKGGLKGRYFITGKFFQAVFALLYTYLLLKIPAVQNGLYSVPVISVIDNSIITNTVNNPVFLIIEAVPVLVILANILRKKITRTLH